MPTDTSHSPIHSPILDAAEACFTRYGVRRTTIEDVAAEAGVSRVTVYRQIGSRDEVVLQTLLRVTDRHLRRIRGRLLSCGVLPEALVQLVVLTLRAARSDDLVLLYASEERGAHGGPIPGASEPLFTLFGDTVAWLQNSLPGELRSDITTDQAGEWVLRFIISLLTIPHSRHDQVTAAADFTRPLVEHGLCA